MPEMKQDTATDSAVSLVRALLRGFTHHHRDLKIKGKRMGSIVAVEISGNRDDMPKIVGTMGGHIAALNRIMLAVATRLGVRIVLSLHEPTIGVKMPPRIFEANPKWKPDATRKLLKQTVDAILPTAPTIEEHHDENVSIFQIVPAAGEESLIDKKLELALASIFDAVGKANGRSVEITSTAAAVSA